jgi:hypothetical protein
MTFERENSVNTSTFHVSISIQTFVRQLGVSEFGTGIAIDRAQRQKNMLRITVQDEPDQGHIEA